MSHRGMLVRKHDWVTSTQRSSKRSWKKVYCVIQGSTLSCYKREKDAKMDPNNIIHYESPIDLKNAKCEIPTDYTKRANVVRLRLATGGVYLFQAKDAADRDLWMSRLMSLTDNDTGDIEEKFNIVPDQDVTIDTSYIHHSGTLIRRHEWEAANVKATDRSWKSVYCVLHRSTLSCYRNQADAEKDPNDRIHGESAIDLYSALCEIPAEYSNRHNVIRLRLPSGGEYLIQTKNEVERDLWISKIQSVIGNEVDNG